MCRCITKKTTTIITTTSTRIMENACWTGQDAQALKGAPSCFSYQKAKGGAEKCLAQIQIKHTAKQCTVIIIIQKLKDHNTYSVANCKTTK